MWNSKAKLLTIIFTVLLLNPLFSMAAEKQKTVAIITVDFQSNTMLRFGNSFSLRAKEYGWNVIKAEIFGDYSKADQYFEEFIERDVDAIFNDMLDPNLIESALLKAKKAGIPVINGDAGFHKDVVTNITSNNYFLSARVTKYLFDKMLTDNKKELLGITWLDHHGIRKRTDIMEAILAEYPEIELVKMHHTSIPGQVQDSRNFVSDYLRNNPDFDGSVWAAWDEPAAGATQAILKARKGNSVYTTGIDGNKWTFDMIRQRPPFLATESQNFEMMGRQVADCMNDIFNKDTETEKVYCGDVVPYNLYVPTILVTQENLPPVGKFPWSESGEFSQQYSDSSSWPSLDGKWGLEVNDGLTINDYTLSALITPLLFDKMTKNSKTDLLVITADDNVASRRRARIMDAVLKTYDNLDVKGRTQIAISDQSVQEAQAAVEEFLKQNPDFKGAIWSSVDILNQGATQAIANLEKGKNVYTLTDVRGF
ncbi:putative ABC-type sugar transport system,periplasmic component [Vibrio nigripulchritudo MADA3029]|uniref:substrate-binding domain-containing protein n=1 Tax=Vibrio nigripulchritudo TaxID=28173 RepID=UPI0003B19A9C|nr:substrate-binding domain-containing protein [Vibrio nigripulchritudo]CCN49837.1 putative ABC-type sugar transport system,periplasmic component [Vibrio nigripulchritudo MADA3020]CCN55295.1 putative ABC-type sugar transport system,periplasmic component [Vibrio nigripulchritudo MADA3021]CCN57998.1 putative ABC-type sugar transport system,periplasmic component [Vibrio nigripulchritudo MADA3029]